MIQLIRKFSQHPFLRFFVIGGSCGLLDLIFIYILTDIFGWWYIYSGIVSFVVVSAVSFLLHKFLTFKNYHTAYTNQFGRYIIVIVVGLVINNSLLYVFTSWLGLWYVISRVLSSLVAMFWNYINNSKYVFAKATS